MIARVSISGLVLCLALAPTGLEAQRSDPDWQAPRTAWGHPDLQGNWSNATLTPFERRRGLSPVYTQAEVDELEGRERSTVQTGSDASNPERGPPPVTGSNIIIQDNP